MMTIMMMMNITIKITDNEYDGSDDDEIIDGHHDNNADGRW